MVLQTLKKYINLQDTRAFGKVKKQLFLTLEKVNVKPCQQLAKTHNRRSSSFLEQVTT